MSVRDALAEALGDRRSRSPTGCPTRPLRRRRRPPVALPARARPRGDRDRARRRAGGGDRPRPGAARGAASWCARRARPRRWRCENERLDAELRARYDDLRAARAPARRRGRRRAPPDRARPARRRPAAPRLARAHARPRAPARRAGLRDRDAARRRDRASSTRGLAELRELARGIHPAVLTERGLEPALDGLAARAPLPVTISGDARGPAPARASRRAAYFVVMEALTNVAKYARATAAEVTVRRGRRRRRDRRARRRRRRRRPGGGQRAARARRPRRRARRRLEVESPPRRGHVVRAELPYRVPSRVGEALAHGEVETDEQRDHHGGGAIDAGGCRDRRPPSVEQAPLDVVRARRRRA